MEFLYGLLTGIIIPFIILAYTQGWIPAKHNTKDKADLINKIFGANSPRKPMFVIRYTIPQYEKDGFKIVRIAFGREFPIGQECTFTGTVTDGTIQEMVLMALPKKQYVRYTRRTGG